MRALIFDFQALSSTAEASTSVWEKELFSLFSRLKEQQISLAMIKGEEKESILDAIPMEFSITKEELQGLGGLSYILNKLKIEAEDSLFLGEIGVYFHQAQAISLPVLLYQASKQGLSNTKAPWDFVVHSIQELDFLLGQPFLFREKKFKRSSTHRIKRSVRNEFLRQRVVNEERAEPGQSSVVLILDHLKPNFNLGKILRSAYAFSVKEVHIIGTQFFNPYPAKGAFKFVPVRFHTSYHGSIEDLRQQGYSIYALDAKGEHSLGKCDLPQKTAFLLGNEGLGISFSYKEEGIQSLGIPQYGKMDSLNVSIAASIALYEYTREWQK